MPPFQYKPRTPAQYAARANFREGGAVDRMFDRDVTMFRPHDGENNLRILPPGWQDPKHFGYTLHVHYGVGPDRGSYLSLSKHCGSADPVDKARAKAAGEGNEKLEKELRCVRRVAVWLIDRADETKGSQLWLSPASVDRKIAALCRDRQTGNYLPIDDPENGYDCYFHKTGKGLATRYEGISLARRSTPLHVDPATKEKWLEHVVANPIPSMLQFYSYERIAAVLSGNVLSAGMQEVAPAETTPAPTPHEV